MWDVTDPDDDAYRASLKRLGQKHPPEFAEVFKHLKELCQYLNSGMPIRDALSLKWVHHKYRLGMKSLAGGGRKGQAALRLYVYPDAKHKTIVVLGIGDKSTQGKDVEKSEMVLAEYLASMMDGDDHEIQTPQNG